MQDLNDILIFTAVVEHKGFSAAGRVLNRPKSSISRHVDRLEARLSVRLLERSTRRVRLTEVGSEYYSRCRAALADLEDADRDVALHRSDPVGIVRMTCPPSLARSMAPIVPGFLANYPKVRLQIQATNNAVDLIKDKIDVAIRARPLLNNESLTMRKLGISRLIFVASPAFADAHALPSEPAGLGKLPFLSFLDHAQRMTWRVQGPGGATQTIALDPVLWTGEFDVLVEAACAGVGIGLLPVALVQEALDAGRLLRVLPDWRSDDVTIHLVFPTARGLRPAVRVLIDYLVANFDVAAKSKHA